MRGINLKNIDNSYLKLILDSIKIGKNNQNSDWLKRKNKNSPSKAITDILKIILLSSAEKHNISPLLIANKEDINQIALGFKNVKADSQQQLITVVVPKPTLDDLTAMEDQVASMSRSAISSLTKIRGNTSQRLKAALENEFIDGVTMHKSRDKVDAVYDKYVKLVKLHALKKRKSILGSYFEPKNEEERLLLPELTKLKPLPEPKE